MLNSTSLRGEGCITKFPNIDNLVDVGASVLGIIALIILLGELLGIALSISLACLIRSAKRYIV